MPRSPQPVDELDDATLARARRGERTACTRFVACYERRVFAAIGRILGPHATPARVEELSQDAFLRALRALPRFTPEGPAKLSTWVLTIATRVALNDLRRVRPVLTSLDAARAVAANDEHARVDARHALQSAIAALTPEQRAVFVLCDIHGLTPSEVAQALDLQVAAAKSRLLRARARLRQALWEDGNG